MLRGRIAASAGAEVLPWRYRPPRCGSSHGEFEEIGLTFRWHRTPQDPGSCAPPFAAALSSTRTPCPWEAVLWHGCGGRVQRTKAVHPVPSPRPFSGAFCGRIRALHGLPHALWPSIPNSRTAENGPGVFVAPVGFAVPTLPVPLLPLRSLLPMLPVRGGRRERACGCSVSRQPCWQGWQRIPGWWREGLAFLPAEQGLSEIAVQGIKGSAGLPLWQHAAVIRAAEVSRRGLCCQAFSCSCRSPFAFCPLLCLCGLCWRSVLHLCLDLSADLHVPAANCLAYAPPFPSVRMQRTAQRV